MGRGWKREWKGTGGGGGHGGSLAGTKGRVGYALLLLGWLPFRSSAAAPGVWKDRGGGLRLEVGLRGWVGRRAVSWAVTL